MAEDQVAVRSPKLDQKEEKHQDCDCSRGGTGRGTRFDLASALTLITMGGCSPLVLSEGRCSHLIVQRRAWLGAELDYGGQEFLESFPPL
jgi:hypothetical protein